jgi:Ca-activated chloride channel family protein
MQLYSPWALLLLLILPVMAYLTRRKRRTAAVRFPSLKDMKGALISRRLKLRPLLKVTRFACLALLIIALARPRKGTEISEIATEGVAIEVVADRSGSMQTEMDYHGRKLNRLQVVKRVLAEFIKGEGGLTGRSNDLVGLVTFARYADTKCPLVHSHDVLLEFLRQTEIARSRSSEDGTAIGDAIALAAARLKKAEEEIERRSAQLGITDEKGADTAEESGFKIKSKVIILLTDGRNNTGQYSPLEAAQLAKEWGIKIYTVGIGSAQAYTTIRTMLGTYKVPTQDNIDEGLLKAIAENTGAFYGRAGDAKTLHNIVKKIDSLEKTKVKSVQYTQYAEHFGPWTMAAVLLLAGEMLSGCTIFRKIP